jgi:Secretion system C-terminal sorting domain
MKKIFFALTFFLFTNHLFAYLPTIEKGKRYQIVKPMGLGQFIIYYHEINCDTIFETAGNTYKYTKVNVCDTFGNKLGGSSFLREDTIVGKVYFKDSAATTESIIIDYSLQIGDSFYFANNNFTSFVDSIKYKFVYGKIRKVIYFDAALTFTEGIGCSFWGVLPSQNIGGSNAYAYINQVSSGINNCTPTSISSNYIAPRKINVYPNPSSNSIAINIDNIPILVDFNIRIQSVIGQLIYNGKCKNSATIDVSKYATGLYLVQLNINENTYVAKFCKQ